MLDDFNGGRLATEHLIARGHRNIAHIYKESVLAALDRRDGHLAALDAAGLPRRPEYACPFTEQDEADNAGYLHARKLLALPERPSAIFCYNDDIAIQVLRAVRGQGLRIPQDVSVIGFDNIRSSGLPDVRLTTIEHPKRLCGRWAADILFDQIEQGQAAIRRRIMIYPELVERDTVASPRR
jgi:GntR family transcriptional regulator of arabinose operon